MVVERPDRQRTFTWLGQTRWRLADGVRYFRALSVGMLASRPLTSTVLRLLDAAGREASPWGLRVAVPKSLRLAMKVGVGTNSEGGWTVRQFAVVGRGRRACVIGVLARAQTEADAKTAATMIARAAVRPALSRPGCS